MRIISRNQPVNPSMKPFVDVSAEPEKGELPHSLAEKREIVEVYLSLNDDAMWRSFQVGSGAHRAAVFYLLGAVDSDRLESDLISRLTLTVEQDSMTGLEPEEMLRQLEKHYLSFVLMGRMTSGEDMIQAVAEGKVCLCIDGIRDAIWIDMGRAMIRGIEQVNNERSIYGAREGFVEDLRVNIDLIRRKIHNTELRVEVITLGAQSRTAVAMMYMKGTAPEDAVGTLRSRLKQVSADAIHSAAFLNQYLEDRPYSIFPQSRITERPDTVAASLLEGRVAVLADQSPVALLYPTFLNDLLQSVDDYYEKFHFGSAMRIVRYIALFLATSAPALYIALVAFQPELIPWDMLIALAKARRQVPFPVVMEVLIQEIVLALIVEASLRIPNQLGQTIGVVAGIMLGQAAIMAKLASPGVIIVVVITVIATYILPNYSLAATARLLRLFLWVSASLFGLYGLSFGWLIILAHLAGLTSAGYPYYAPFAPTRYRALQDALIRVPVQMHSRQSYLNKQNGQP